MLKRFLVAAAILLAALSAPALAGDFQHHVAGGHLPPVEVTVNHIGA